MGVIQNLQMNLDFMFNASNAYKGATKLKGSFAGVLDQMVQINKQSEIAGTSLGTTFDGADIINFSKS